MTISLTSMRNAVLGLTLLFGSSQVFAEDKSDAQTIEEVTKFADEGSKMREAHIQEMREIHLKHVNEMYDRKLAHNKEMAILWKQFKPGDKKANKVLHGQIKDKHKAFKKEDEKFREDFHENVLKKKNKDFGKLMHARQKEMKDKFKD